MCKPSPSAIRSSLSQATAPINEVYVQFGARGASHRCKLVRTPTPLGSRVSFRLLLLALLVPRLVAAQSAGGSNTRAPDATVSGVVHDSIGRRPLAGATVQLVAAGNQSRFASSAVSDSLGRFTINDVPDGRYMLGFLHPMLDSLGIEPPVREVVVDRRRSQRADLAIPSPTRLRDAFCGAVPRSPPTVGGVVIGVARDARSGAPLAGVTVTAEWIEISVSDKGLESNVPRRVATTAESGRFTVCGVPSPGSISLTATRGADNTDIIEVRLPAHGFTRRELYLGPGRSVATGAVALSADSLAPQAVALRVGDGQLSGTVVGAPEGRPVTGARVSILDGPETRTNERGEWTLSGAPTGTRVLDVRAVGYSPERAGVDVVSGAPQIRTTLSTIVAVMDTVRVTALSLVNENMADFEKRRRSTAGYFVTAEDIARQQPIFTSDLFRTVPGVSVQRSGFDADVLMRAFGADRCRPHVYINGMYMMASQDGGGILDWVGPDEVLGIEIYRTSMVPAQFRPPFWFGVCGSIVVWTKPVAGKKWTKKRVATLVGAVGIGVALSFILRR